MRLWNNYCFSPKKRDGSVKAHKVDDGSKQRTHDGHEKSDGSSPTVITESIFLTGVVDAKEGRATAMVDVGTAFLNADNDERILMLLRGKLAEMMVRIDPVLCRQYVTYSKNGIPMLCVRLTKALCGMLRAALLFYKKLCGDLELVGFEINPCSPCVANVQVDGSQLTECWHVDDLKISHKSELVVTGFVAKLGQMYGGKLTVSRGKVHDYLGMDLDFSSEPGLRLRKQDLFVKKEVSRASSSAPRFSLQLY